MAITRISYEERVGRIEQGLASDPDLGVSLLRELSAITLKEYFGGDLRPLRSVCNYLRGEGITLLSSFGSTMAAIDRVWERDPDLQAGCSKVILALIGPLAGGPDSSKGGSASAAKQRPSSAPLGLLDSCPPPSFSDRVGGVSSTRPRIVGQVAKMRYAAYIEAASMVAGTDAVANRNYFDRYWAANLSNDVSVIMRFIQRSPGSHRLTWLLETFLVKPYAAIDSEGSRV